MPVYSEDNLKDLRFIALLDINLFSIKVGILSQHSFFE